MSFSQLNLLNTVVLSLLIEIVLKKKKKRRRKNCIKVTNSRFDYMS